MECLGGGVSTGQLVIASGDQEELVVGNVRREVESMKSAME